MPPLTSLSPWKCKLLVATLTSHIIGQSDDEDPPLVSPVAFSCVSKSGSVKPHPPQGGERVSSACLERMPTHECIWRFQFVADELLTLARVLDLPNPLITATGYCASSVECLGLLCARLQSPEDQWSLSTKYARPQLAISEITNATAKFIQRHWAHLLSWDHEGVVLPKALQVYACALQDFGAPSASVALFIDCTIRQTCRPGVFQELAYTGYKKFHGMKFQGLTTPNGLLVHLDGPYRAPQNDSGVLNLSNLVCMMEKYAIQPGSVEGDPPEKRYFQVYGDLAYGVSPVMVSPYAGARELMPEQRAWNSAMGGLRISVEHGFGLVLQDWPWLQCFWKQKIWGTACGVMYRAAVLLTNAHACVRPNQTLVRYNCPPPYIRRIFS